MNDPLEAMAVIVPTRGRPGNAARLEAAFSDTDVLHAFPVFAVDADDPELPAYRELLRDGHIRKMVIYSNTRGMCAVLNAAAVQYARMYGAVGFMGDDHLPRTTGWDDTVLEHLDSPLPRVVYGNDLLQGAALPTAVFMQSRMINAMGWMAPPVLSHLYADNAWKILGESLNGLVYLPDVIIEHLHPVNGKAVWDERYQVVNAPDLDHRDREAFHHWCDEGLPGTLNQVRFEYSK